MDQFEDPDEQRTWVFDATFLRSNRSCIYGDGCKGVLDARRADARPGLLQLRRPLRRRRRRADRGERVRAARAAAHGSSTPRRKKGFLRPGDARRRRHGADHDAGRRRRLHLPQPTRASRAAPGARCTSPRSRPASDRIDWKPNVCWQVPIRLEHHTDDNGYVTSTACGSGSGATGATAAPSSTGGAPKRRGVQRRASPSYKYLARRDRRDGEQADLRPDGRPARASELDATAPPDGAQPQVRPTLNEAGSVV